MQNVYSIRMNFLIAEFMSVMPYYISFRFFSLTDFQLLLESGASLVSLWPEHLLSALYKHVTETCVS